VDRDRFIAGRGLLRAILGRYLGLPPERLRFYYGPQGKPALDPDSEEDGIQFNVSHCHDFALFAVTRGRQVGIDLERIRPLPEAGQVAERFFSAQERSVFHALPESDRQLAFFRCWTRKEAFIKAEGQGLSLPLDGFDVSLAPGQPAKLLAVKRDPEEASRWSLYDLWPAPGFVAAVAAEGSGWCLRRWQWREDALRKSAILHGAGIETLRIEGYSFS
jgi:4'-phosphopantetheinyl transferase